MESVTHYIIWKQGCFTSTYKSALIEHCKLYEYLLMKVKVPLKIFFLGEQQIQKSIIFYISDSQIVLRVTLVAYRRFLSGTKTRQKVTAFTIAIALSQQKCIT